MCIQPGTLYEVEILFIRCDTIYGQIDAVIPTCSTTGTPCSVPGMMFMVKLTLLTSYLVLPVQFVGVCVHGEVAATSTTYLHVVPGAR